MAPEVIQASRYDGKLMYGLSECLLLKWRRCYL
ncbi:hypothetical protein RDI58_012325 [Solanum bulbocastanum]|uniref:Uncharacterized protein n=1 Tax=Solanum bulbocastanum TaxID=147425 RepID=A0AAN8TNW0_SOLBU